LHGFFLDFQVSQTNGRWHEIHVSNSTRLWFHSVSLTSSSFLSSSLALHSFHYASQSIPSLLTLPGPSLAQLTSSALSTLSTLSLPLDLPLIYSPSHIALASIHFHSPEHTTLYLQHKERLSITKVDKKGGGPGSGTVLESAKVLSVVEEIVVELREEERKRKGDEGGKLRIGKVKEVDRRLRGCGNPARMVGSAL